MKKSIDFHIRISEETFAKIQLLAEHYNTDKSKLIRRCIELNYAKLEGESNDLDV